MWIISGCESDNVNTTAGGAHPSTSPTALLSCPDLTNVSIPFGPPALNQFRFCSLRQA
jgi:hypothetical protein